MRRILIASMVAVIGSSSASAGIFQDVFHGLQLVATPSGFPVFTSGDGTRVNGQRTGRVRIIPETLGQGYSLEFDRRFGADSAGRSETFDLGPVDMQLDGSTSMTAGFTRRGFLIGSLNFNANALNYVIRGKTGAQNTELNGTIDAGGNIEINQFGFYDASLIITNSNSRLLVDGVVADDLAETNLEIGPINVQGNIFVDLLVAGLAQAGVDTSGLQALFPRSPINEINNAIQQALPQNTVDLLNGGVTQPRQALGVELPDSLDAFVAPITNGAPGTLPEPGTFALLALGGITLLRRR